MVSFDTIVPPPFALSSPLLASVARLERVLGRLEGLSVEKPQPMLRKRNRVRTVGATTAIEGNRLDEAQVTAVLDGKRVVGRAQDVQEIVNANEAYERLAEWKPTSSRSLLVAHAVLMKGLLPGAGRFRTSGVGVFRGERLTHLAPPAHLVADQVKRLLRWAGSTDTPRVVTACVVHYELLFIHPFIDGNGRLARLWQQVVQREHAPVLEFVPVESVIRSRQPAYYAALRASDRGGACTPFLEFLLEALAEATQEFADAVRPERETQETRLARARLHFAARWFSRADYLALHPRLSTATASRDLAAGVAAGALRPRGHQRLTEYRFQPR